LGVADAPPKKAAMGFMPLVLVAASRLWASVGADGEATVSRSNNRSATIKIKLMATSDGHRLLEQLYAAQQAASNGAPIAFELRDVLGARVEHADACVFVKPPATSHGATVSEREWSLFTERLIREVV
jgi:hypothetical protein